MFPEVHRASLIALKKFCTYKDHSRTMQFLDKVWDSRALNFMMTKTQTRSLESLVHWLIAPDTKEKIQFINNNY